MNSYRNIPGNASWKDPVDSESDLPSSGNTAGDARVTIDDESIWIWGEDNTWHEVSGGGGGGIESINGDTTAAQEIVGGGGITVDTSSGTTTVTNATYASATAQGMTFTAREAGPAGNSIVVDLLDPGVPDSPLSINVAGDTIEVSLESGPSEAERTATGQGLTWTVKNPPPEVEPLISVTLLGGDFDPTPRSLSVDMTLLSSEYYMTVNLEVDGGGNTVTTADDLVAAWPSVGDGFDWTTLTGSGNTPLSTDEYLFEDGMGDSYSLISTTAEVVLAVTNDVDANDLVSATGGNGTLATVENIPLSGGSNTGLVSGNYNLEVQETDEGNETGAITYDLSTSSSRYLNIAGAITLTLDNPQSGGAYLFLVEANGTNTITWPGNVTWLVTGAAAPDFSGMADGDIVLVNLYYSGTKSEFYGTYAPQA